MKRKRRQRPPQKLFDMEAVRAIGGEISQDGDFIIFEGNRYSRKGFLYKNFVMSAIQAEGGLCVTCWSPFPIQAGG